MLDLLQSDVEHLLHSAACEVPRRSAPRCTCIVPACFVIHTAKLQNLRFDNDGAMVAEKSCAVSVKSRLVIPQAVMAERCSNSTSFSMWLLLHRHRRAWLDRGVHIVFA